MLIWLRVIVSCLCFLFVSFSSASQLSNQERISKGVDWLLNQQFSNGSFTSDIALDWQSTDEALVTLKASNSWDQLAKQLIFSWWLQESIPYFEYRVRSINLASNLGEDSIVKINDLINHQNSDGGFSAYEGWESDSYSTAQALSILSLEDDKHRSNIINVIEYLRQVQKINGSFHSHQNKSSLFLTAQILIGLKPFQFEYDISSILAKSQDYLLVELVNATDYSIAEVATALLSIIPLTTDTARYQMAVEYLMAYQQDNGSWGSDAYSTALALQALQMVENSGVVTDPLKSTIQGGVYIFNTNSGISNAAITIEGISEIITSDAGGRFQVSNLEEGEYSLVYSASGYYPATQTLALKAGQLVDVGGIYLTPLPANGIVKGVILSADTGLPLQGVKINISGIHEYSATTASDGSYQIEVMPGAISFNTEFEGYQFVAGTAVIEAGKSLLMSASLYRVDEQLPSDVSIKGKVINQTNEVVSNAQITVNGTQVGQTDTLGEFTISNISVGGILLQVSANNYRSKILSLNASQVGEANIGNIILEEYIATASSTISGKVVDENGDGIPFSNLVFSQLDSGSSTPNTIATQADQYGEFKVASVDFFSIGLEISADGFITNNQNLQITEHGDISVGSILLERDPIEEVTKISGRILSELNSSPIPFAEIQLTQLDVPVNLTPIVRKISATKQGDFIVENIEFYRMQAFVTATGYQSLIQELSLQEFEKTVVDFELQSYKSGSASITEFKLNQSEYPAYSEVEIQGVLINTDIAAKRVFVKADIKDSLGTSIQQILIGDEKDLAGKPLPITLIPNTPVDIKGNWFTGINQPGRYEVVLSLYDPLNSQILNRKSNFIEIVETASLNSVSILASPKVSKVGAQEELTINAVVKYFGNTESNYSLKYEFIDPDDQSVSSGTHQISLSPGDTSMAIQLPAVDVEFNMSGRYLLRAEIENSSLDVASDWIVVAPSTRVDVNHELIPIEVLPGKDQQLKVEIKLQGVEQP